MAEPGRIVQIIPSHGFYVEITSTQGGDSYEEEIVCFALLESETDPNDRWVEPMMFEGSCVIRVEQFVTSGARYALKRRVAQGVEPLA
jgi:hypothetical protein